MVLKNTFSSWWIIQFLEKLWKMWENIKTLQKRKELISITTKLSYYKVFCRKCISNRNKKKILMNKPVCLGLSKLELSKILMYELWYYYVKPNYGEKSKLFYIVRQFLCMHKNRCYLQRNCRRCWNKIWHFKFLNRQTIAQRKK